MSLVTWWRSLREHRVSAAQGQARRRLQAQRPRLEVKRLDDRLLPAASTIAVASNAGLPGAVLVFNGNGTPRFPLVFGPYAPHGVAVAVGDVTGGSFPDIIVSPIGVPGAPIFGFNGGNSQFIGGFFAAPLAYAGPITLDAGDVDGDGRADIIVGFGPGTGGFVRVFSGANGAPIRDFRAFPEFLNFPVAITVAAGDVDGNGRADIIVGAGPGTGGFVRVFSDAPNHALIRNFLAFPGFMGSISVGTADVDGNGRADILVGTSAGLVGAFSDAPSPNLFSVFVGFPGGTSVTGG